MGVMQTVAKIGMALASFTGSEQNPLNTPSMEKTTPVPVTRTAEPGIDLAKTYFVSTPRQQDGEPQDGQKPTGIKYREPTQLTYRQPLSERMQYRQTTVPQVRPPTQIVQSPPTQIIPSIPTQVIPSGFGYNNYGYGVPYRQYGGLGYQPYSNSFNYGRGYSGYNNNLFSSPYGYRPPSVRLGFPVGDSGYLNLYNNRGVPGLNFSAPGFNYNTSPFGGNLNLRDNGSGFRMRW